MTCKDCYHFEACNHWLLKDKKYLDSVEGFICKHFKERSEIIELPCKVGDTVYHLQRTGNIAKRKVERFEASSSGVYFVFDNKEKYPIEWKTVFLTKEAAEQALDWGDEE